MPAETFLRSAPLPLPNLSFMRLLPRPTAFLDLARTMASREIGVEVFENKNFDSMWAAEIAFNIIHATTDMHSYYQMG